MKAYALTVLLGATNFNPVWAQSSYPQFLGVNQSIVALDSDDRAIIASEGNYFRCELMDNGADYVLITDCKAILNELQRDTIEFKNSDNEKLALLMQLSESEAEAKFKDALRSLSCTLKVGDVSKFSNEAVESFGAALGFAKQEMNLPDDILSDWLELQTQAAFQSGDIEYRSNRSEIALKNCS